MILKINFVILCTSFWLTVFSQHEDIESDIGLATKKGNIIGAHAMSKATLSLIEGSQDFKALIRIFPIVPDPDAEDSVQQLQKPLILKIMGKFPIENIDFLTTDQNGRSYMLRVSATLNDSTRTIPFNIALITLHDPSISPNGNLPIFQTRINFECAIQPLDFGINDHPFDIKNPVFITGTNVVLNKSE